MAIKKEASKIVSFPSRKGFKVFVKALIKNSYHRFLDSRIKNIAPLSTEYALGYMKRQDFSNKTKILVTAIKHPCKSVVIEGIQLLSMTKKPEAKRALKACISHKDQDVVLAAINAIRFYNDSDIIIPLQQCLSRKNRKIAIQALWALAEIKTPAAIKVIEESMYIQDEELNRTADWILKGLSSKRRKIKA